MHPNQAALIIVDMQHYFVEAGSRLMTLVEHIQPGFVGPYVERVNQTVIPAIQALLETFRANRAPIFFTVFGSDREDGSDLPLWARKINDMSLASSYTLAYPEFHDASARIIPVLAPEAGEEVLRKTTAGTLSSTELHSHLKNLGVTHVVVCGVNTNVCVGQTARELADRGYDAVMVEDGCATLSADAHRTTLETFNSVFGQARSVAEIISELQGNA